MVGRGKGGRNPFAVWGVSWSPDGRTLAVSTRYDDLVQLWMSQAVTRPCGQRTIRSQTGSPGHPLGDTFATSDDEGKVQIWSRASGKIVTTLSDHSEAGWSYALAWSLYAQLTATTRETGLVQVWSVSDGKQRAALPAHYTSS